MIEIFAKILCYGLAVKEEDVAYFTEKYFIEDDFVSGSVFLIDGIKPINTIVSLYNSNPDIPVLKKAQGDHGDYVMCNGKEVPVSPIAQPQIIMEYNGDISDFNQKYFRMHNSSTLFVSSIRECIFIKEGRGCKFCTFDKGTPSPISTSVVGDVFSKICHQIGKIPAVALGSGTPNKRDHGVRYNAKIVKELRSRGAQEISVELVPPHNLDDLEILYDAGCDSLISSIEIWNDEIRHRDIPGKSYISKSKYIEMWRRAANLFGRGNISSVLIIGLEPISEVEKAIDIMTEIGVVPTLIPYRKYPTSKIDSQYSPRHEDYINISYYNSRAMSKNGIDPLMQVGCTKCGGCSLDTNLSKIPSFEEVV